MKSFRELIEKVSTDDIVKELIKIHAEMNGKNANEKIMEINSLFGKYGTKEMNKAILKFVDTEVRESLDIDKIIKDIKAIDTKNIADVKVETVSGGNYIDVSFKNSSAQTKVAKAINKKFNYAVDFDGTHLLVTVKGL